MKYIKPISFYSNQKPLAFYLMNCGGGLTHLIIFPGETVMLFDCNLVDDNSASGGMTTEQILNFFKKVIPCKVNDSSDKYNQVYRIVIWKT